MLSPDLKAIVLLTNRTVDKHPQKITFQNSSTTRQALFNTGCLTCGGENIEVKYYGQRHLCLQCREKLKTFNEDSVFVMLDDNGDVLVLAKSQNNEYY